MTEEQIGEDIKELNNIHKVCQYVHNLFKKTTGMERKFNTKKVYKKDFIKGDING